MSPRRLQLTIVILVLIAAMLGCNLPEMADGEPQGEVQNDTVVNAVEEEPAGEAEPDAPPEPQPEPAAALPEFNLADPCSIVSPQVAEAILGQPAEGIPGPGVCVYAATTKSINVSGLEGEEAKRSMASQVLQLENGCEMSFSYSSDQPDPTPLPPEADPLLAMSMQELLEHSLTVQQSCGWPAVETLTDYGPGVYLMPVEIFMPGGQVSIATENYILTILYIDVEQDAAASVEVARQILEMVTSGQ